MYINQDRLGLRLVLTFLLLSVPNIIDYIALISSFIKHVMSQSDVKVYTDMDAMPLGIISNFHSFVNLWHLPF